jgi:mercuric ion binding protein
MKTKILVFVALFLMGPATVFAASKTEKVEVKGICELCKNRIEKSALSVEGVSKAVWNKESKIIELVFDDSKTSLLKVETAISKVGHDTPLVKTTDEVFKKLPGCCKYNRSASSIGGLEGSVRDARCPKP